MSIDSNGLKDAQLGHPIFFTLDARNLAGSGQLNCRCRTPSGNWTSVLISHNKDGTYKVDLNASEPGLHMIEAEWNGKIVPGSPFVVPIMQAAHAKCVRVYGPGVISVIIDNFQGVIHVDTKGSGPGDLEVRINGPNEVEMYREHLEDRVIDVRYNPTVVGVYSVHVLWSGVHVHGSPFEIFVAPNGEQLKCWNDNWEDVVEEFIELKS